MVGRVDMVRGRHWVGEYMNRSNIVMLGFGVRCGEREGAVRIEWATKSRLSRERKDVYGGEGGAQG